MVTVGGVGCPIRNDSTMIEPEKEDSTVDKMEVERNESESGRTQVQGSRDMVKCM
jgi:hypothetical protein